VLSTQCVAVLPRGHRLTKLKHLNPSNFAGEPFISFSSGSPLRSQIDQVFSDAGVERRITVETDLGISVCALVAAGLGVGLINPLAAREEREVSEIEIRPFTPAIPVTIALLYPPYASQDRLIEAFARHARQVLASELAGL
jgi:DNA-binding transcriptional LysR family regulator